MIQSVIQGLRCLSVTCNIPQSCPAGDLCCILHLSFPSFPVFCLNKAHNAAKHTLKKTTMTLYLCMTPHFLYASWKKFDFLEPKAQLTSSWISSAGERHFDWFSKINIRIKYSSCGVCRVQTTCVFEPPSTTGHFWGNGSSAPSITHAPAAFRFVWSPLTNLNSPNYPRQAGQAGLQRTLASSWCTFPRPTHFTSAYIILTLWSRWNICFSPPEHFEIIAPIHQQKYSSANGAGRRGRALTHHPSKWNNNHQVFMFLC